MIGIDTLLIILVLCAGFYMAWNIGANDVSNAMGTSVGSGALTLGKAVIIAGVLEFCGAYFLGANVSNTIQHGIVNPDVFADNPKELLYGMLAALISTAVWLQVASYFGWPVSTTHAIIGALLGFGLVAGGASSIHWGEIGAIAASWVVSPALSGLVSFMIFTVLQRKVLYALSPIHAAKRLLPFFSALLFITFTLSVLLAGFGGHKAELNGQETLLLALGIGFAAFIVTALLVRKRVSPHITTPDLTSQVYSLNKIIKHLKRILVTAKGSRREQITDTLVDVRAMADEIKTESGFYERSTDYNVVEKMFAYLQILSASYVAFAHGANDVANAIGPVAAALEILRKGSLGTNTPIPSYLLALGGAGIVIGLATWGWRVMETIGKKITELTPTRGFCAEFGAAATILVASKAGLPISTTHCLVGSVLGVGLARGLSALNLRMVRDIVLSWIITIPSSALVCILFYQLLSIIF